jgi:hypothetical protein
MIVTVLLICTYYKSLQLQHVQSLLFVILSSQIITRYWLLATAISHGQQWTAIAYLQLMNY